MHFRDVTESGAVSLVRPTRAGALQRDSIEPADTDVGAPATDDQGDRVEPRPSRTQGRYLIALLVPFALAICYAAQDVLIPVVLALLISLLLSPAVSLLERIRVPRAMGSCLILIALVGMFAGGITRLAQPARDWIANAPKTIQTIERRFDGFREPIREAQEASKKIQDLAQPSSSPQTLVTEQPSLLATMATGTPRVLASVAVVLILVYFFLSSGDSFLRRWVEVTPRLTDKKLVVSIARDVQGEMSRYLLMVSCINIALGSATAVAMKLMGVPNPLLWGAVAAVLNFAPYVGAATTGLMLLAAGFTAFDTLGHALAVPGIFFCLAFIEGQLITPTIIGRRLALDPAVVFVWLMLWGWLWGIVGILLAGPLLACFRILCQRIDRLHAIGILISDGSAPNPVK
jgi:predicted PurR-regulated permease PerM